MLPVGFDHLGEDRLDEVIPFRSRAGDRGTMLESYGSMLAVRRDGVCAREPLGEVDVLWIPLHLR
jgi:hypothetical protein